MSKRTFFHSLFFTHKDIKPSFPIKLSVSVLFGVAAFALYSRLNGLAALFLSLFLVSALAAGAIKILSRFSALERLDTRAEKAASFSVAASAYYLLFSLIAPHFDALHEVYNLALSSDRQIKIDKYHLLFFFISCVLLLLAGYLYKRRQIWRRLHCISERS